MNNFKGEKDMNENDMKSIEASQKAGSGISRREFIAATGATTGFLIASAPSMVRAAGENNEFDIVINNGRVMDPETNFDAVRNVGIRGGKIVTITDQEITGKETIDATGHAVVPGFIDAQLHEVETHGHRLMIRDGRTTIMDLEVGSPPTKIDEFYKKFAGNSILNYGTCVSHEFARAEVLDGFDDWKHLTAHDGVVSRKFGQEWSLTRPNLEQGNQILAMMDEGLRQGAVGAGSTLGYMRDGVSSRELYEV